MTANARRGLIAAQIPASASLFSAAERWLEVSVGSEALLPRTRLAATPYAFKAAEVSGERGLPGSVNNVRLLD